MPRRPRALSRSWLGLLLCGLGLLNPRHVLASDEPDPWEDLDCVHGETTPLGEGAGGSIFFEQDSVLPWLGSWGGDENYTMGLAFQAAGTWVRTSGLAKPLEGLDVVFQTGKLHKKLRCAQGLEYVQDHTLTFGSTAFTPNRIELAGPIPDDRPYASLLFLQVARATIDPYARRMVRSDLTLGVLGLRISESVQTSIHTSRREKKGPGALRPFDPEGWPNQISDGGEPTLKYTASFVQALSESTPHDLVLNTEANLGYYTNAAAGLTLRVGWLRSDFWSFSSNPLTPANQVIDGEGPGPKRNRSRTNLELYAWSAGRVRAVAYNALLQGQFRDSRVTLSGSEIERLVAEWEAGITLGWKGVGVVLAIAQRSSEYSVGVNRSHTWGGIYLSYRGKGGSYGRQ